MRYCKKQLFYSINIISKIITQKIQNTIVDTFTKKNPLRNLTGFHDELYELEILEIFTTMLSLKAIKKSPQERCEPPKNCLT